MATLEDRRSGISRLTKDALAKRTQEYPWTSPEEMHDVLRPGQQREVALNDDAVETVVYKAEQAAKRIAEIKRPVSGGRPQRLTEDLLSAPALAFADSHSSARTRPRP